MIIGLDGATFDVLRPLAEEGSLPTLARWMAQGTCAPLYSTSPPATLPAWASFLTGTEPGHHGVTDIFVHPAQSYDLVPGGGHLRRVPTFLQALSQAGRKVASLGMPTTYPPEPISGVTVAGFDAPGARSARADGVWPPSFFETLETMGGWNYAVFNEHDAGPSHLRRALLAILDDLDHKESVITQIAEQTAWDCFVVHLQASDTVAHHFWHAHDPKSPRHAVVPSDLHDAMRVVFARLDALIGRLVRQFPSNTRVMVVSDHGMGGASDEAVHLNAWLAEQGWLTFHTQNEGLRRTVTQLGRRVLTRAPLPLIEWTARNLPSPLKSLATRLLRGQSPIDFANSLAFSDELDYAPSIWLNRTSRFPEGTLDDRQAEALATQIVTAAKQLRSPPGHAIFEDVFRREELHGGPALKDIPDILLVPAWPHGYRTSFLPSHARAPAQRRILPQEFFAPKGGGLPGVHRPDGVFIANQSLGPTRWLDSLHIAEAGALVWHAMGLDLPTTVTAGVPCELTDALGLRRPTRSASQMSLPVEPRTRTLSAHDRDAVMRRWRSLGYLY